MAFSNSNAMSSNVAYMGGYGINMPSTSAPSNGMPTGMEVGMGLQAGGAALGAMGAYSSTAARQNMLNMDAQIADWQGAQAIVTGNAEGESAGLQSGALFGRQRANLAANGVQLGSGSALDVLASTRYLGEVNHTTIHNNALKQAWAYDTQASVDRYAAQGLNPRTSALTSLLGGAGSVAASWYRYSGAQNGA